MANNKIRLFKSKELPELDEQTIGLIVNFIQFAAKYLKMEDQPVSVRLLHAAPKEPITTGCYSPQDKKITTICQNRHFIDYCRTIAHEMTHQKQDIEGRVGQENQEIGGEIEDEANAVSGQIVKSYLKTQLKPEQKKFLGLGTY